MQILGRARSVKLDREHGIVRAGLGQRLAIFKHGHARRTGTRTGTWLLQKRPQNNRHLHDHQRGLLRSNARCHSAQGTVWHDKGGLLTRAMGRVSPVLATNAAWNSQHFFEPELAPARATRTRQQGPRCRELGDGRPFLTATCKARSRKSQVSCTPSLGPWKNALGVRQRRTLGADKKLQRSIRAKKTSNRQPCRDFSKSEQVTNSTATAFAKFAEGPTSVALCLSTAKHGGGNVEAGHRTSLVPQVSAGWHRRAAPVSGSGTQWYTAQHALRRPKQNKGR